MRRLRVSLPSGTCIAASLRHPPRSHPLRSPTRRRLVRPLPAAASISPIAFACTISSRLSRRSPALRPDHRSIDRPDAAFDAMGLERAVVVSARCSPIRSPHQIVDRDEPPDGDGPGDSSRSRRGVVPLPIRERNLPEDPSTAHPDLTWGWNAFSGSGEVEAEVVYVNHGLEADYAKLRDWGVDVAGKIVLARYGAPIAGTRSVTLSERRCGRAASSLISLTRGFQRWQGLGLRAAAGRTRPASSRGSVSPANSLATCSRRSSLYGPNVSPSDETRVSSPCRCS